MDNLTRQIADFAADLKYDQLPAQVVAASTRSLVDALACAICHAHGGQGLGGMSTAGFRMRNGRLV